MKTLLRLLKSFWVLLPLLWLTSLATCWLLSPLSPWLRQHLPEALAIVSAVFLLVIVLRQYRRIRAEQNLEHLLQIEADRSRQTSAGFQDRQVLRERLKHAITLLRTDRTAGGGGNTALSDLPWYLLIGEAGAGKTSLLAQSGLAASNATADADDDGPQHCDFHLCPDAVLIDTVGRYLHEEQSASEFRDFLRMLRKQRGKAAINGLVLVVDIADLLLATGDERRDLATRLGKLLEGHAACLGSRPPLYLMLSKLDQLPGFAESFAGLDLHERQQPLGMTFGLEELHREGLQAVIESRMENLYRRVQQQVDARLHLSGVNASSLINFPRYFNELTGALQTFLQHLAPDQNSAPSLLRGLYFTSATQDHKHLPRLFEDKVLEEFSLCAEGDEAQAKDDATSVERRGYFITDVFRRVIFPDRDLVRHRLRQERRTGAGPLLLMCAGVAAVLLVGWQTLSFVNNRDWLFQVRNQLASSQSLELLREQMETVDTYRLDGVPLSLGAGLYQGEAIHGLTRGAYLQQLRARILEPITRDLQVQLRQFNTFASTVNQDLALDSAPTGEAAHAQNVGAGLSLSGRMLGRLDAEQVESIVEAYNRLKLYLLLSEPQMPGAADFVAANLRRAWPGIDDGQLVEDNLPLYLRLLEQGQAPALPRNQSLIAETRDNLKGFMIASSLVDREYLRLQLESSQRFPALTLDDLVAEPGRALFQGSASVPAIYTREGWETFVRPELIKLVSADLRNDSDWVLDGEDDHAIVQKANFVREFMHRYKRDYAQAWYRVASSVEIRRFGNLSVATRQLGMLSDIHNSPIKRLLLAIDDNTRWDLPRELALPGTGDLPQQGFWNKVSGLFDSGDSLPAPVSPVLPVVEDGNLAKRFAPVSRLFASHDAEGADSTLIDRYLAALRTLKVRLHNVQRAQDVGKSSKQLISETLEGQPNEVTALRNYVEASIDTSQDPLSRSLLVLFERPLEHAWETLRAPAGQQIAKAWTQQIARPWEQVMAHRYPIAAGSRNEASVKDLQRFVAPDTGLLPNFKRNEIGNLSAGEGLGPGKAQAALVKPQMLSSIDRASSVGEVIASLSDRENGFEIMLEPSGRFTDILFTLDGQEQHYRNGRSSWTRFTWPGDGKAPGARLDVVNLDGSRFTVFDFPGRWGLLRMNESAAVEELDGIRQRFSWNTRQGRVSLLVRNFGGVKLTDLGQVKALESLGDSGVAR